MTHPTVDKTLSERLNRQLKESCELGLSLNDLLVDEQTCLIRLHSDRLIELAHSKQSLMHELDQQFKILLAAVDRTGLPHSLAGVKQLVAECAHYTPEIVAQFKTFQNVIAQADRLNNINQELVQEQLSSVQQRMQILLNGAQEKSAHSAVYGPAGALRPPSTSTSHVVVR